MIKISDTECFSGRQDDPIFEYGLQRVYGWVQRNEFDLNHSDPPYGINMGGGKIGNSKIDYKQFSGADESIPEKVFLKYV